MTATVNGQVDVSTPVLHSLAIKGPRPWIDVTAYGILPANTAAVNQAAWTTLAAALVSGDVVLFPSGTYQFNDTPTITSLSFVTVRSDRGVATIQQTTTGKGGIKLTSCTNCSIVGLGFVGPNGTPTESALDESAVYVTGNYNRVIDCDIDNTWAQCGVNYESGDYGVVTGCTMYGKDPNPIVEAHCGIRARGNYVLLEKNHIESFSNNISISNNAPYGHRIIDNYLMNGRNLNAYLASCSLGEFSGNILENTINRRGIKVGYTTNALDIHGNTFMGCDILVDYSFGVKIRGNTIDEGAITCNADLNDVSLSVYSAIIEGNTIRNTPYSTDVAQTTGAINALGRNLLIRGNLIERAGGHGIAAYNATGLGLTGWEITNNTIRMSGLNANNTCDAIHIGGGYGEDISNLRVIGNTLTSRTRPITITGTTTNTSTTVTGLSAAELNSLEVGDIVTGTGIQAGTTISALSAAGEMTLSLPATASGSITITVATPQMRYGISLTGTGEVDIWGNRISGAATADTSLGSTTVAALRSLGDITATGTVTASKIAISGTVDKQVLDINATITSLSDADTYGAPRLWQLKTSGLSTNGAIQQHIVALGAASTEIRVYLLDAIYNDGIIITEIFGSSAAGNIAQYSRDVTVCANGVGTRTNLSAAGASCFAVGTPTWTGTPSFYYAIPWGPIAGTGYAIVTICGQGWEGSTRVRVV